MMNGIRYVHTLNLTTNTATRDIMFDLKHINPPLFSKRKSIVNYSIIFTYLLGKIFLQDSFFHYMSNTTLMPQYHTRYQ